MELTDNQHITKSIAQQLEKNGWTMETLATAHPRVLARYKGVGVVTANKIITEAKKLVNEQKLAEASVDESPALPPESKEEPPAMSVRLRRLRERNANRT